jgi:ribosomal protein L31
VTAILNFFAPHKLIIYPDNQLAFNETYFLFFSGKLYENNYKLTAHITGVHKRIKQYHCTECNKSYIWKSGAMACEARHRKCYRCEYCDEVFEKLYLKIDHVADCHPMFGGDVDVMASDFDMYDFGDFEI